MKKITLLITLMTILLSCNGNPQKDKVTELLKEKIGNQLPFNDIKIAEIENGTGIIVDGNWCYWIDKNDKIYCVNGASKSIYKVNNSSCEDAPINATYLDIEKIAK